MLYVYVRGITYTNFVSLHLKMSPLSICFSCFPSPRETVHGCQEVSFTSRSHSRNLGLSGQVLERGLCDPGAVHHCHRGVHSSLWTPQSCHGTDARAGERDWGKWTNAEASWGWGTVPWIYESVVFKKWILPAQHLHPSPSLFLAQCYWLRVFFTQPLLKRNFCSIFQWYFTSCWLPLLPLQTCFKILSLPSGALTGEWPRWNCWCYWVALSEHCILIPTYCWLL